MDPASLSFHVRVMTLFLLGAARCAAAAATTTDPDSDCCPDIPPRPQTKPPPQGCYKINDWYRYDCVEGYTRKAGTSKLIKCKQNGRLAWTEFKLECIPIPVHPRSLPTEEYTDTPYDSTITITVTPSSTILQMNSSASMSTNTKTPESTSSGPGQWSRSLHTHDTTESVTVTTTTARTSSSSTMMLSTIKDESFMQKNSMSRTATAVSLGSVFLLLAAIGMSLFYIRWVKHRKPAQNTEQKEEEAIPMNEPGP